MALLGLGLVLWKLPEPRQDQIDLHPNPSIPIARSLLARVDFAGATSLVGMVLTGLLCLDQATKSASYITTGCLGAAFITCTMSFYLVESYWAKEPILPLELVFKRDVLTSYLIICFQAAGQFGVRGSPFRFLSTCSLLTYFFVAPLHYSDIFSNSPSGDRLYERNTDRTSCHWQRGWHLCQPAHHH